MGIINDFKKILFGAKSVAKSTVEKVEEKFTEEETSIEIENVEEKVPAPETTAKDDLLGKTEKMLDEMTEEFKDDEESTQEKIKGEAKEMWDNAKNKTGEFIDDIQDSEAYKKATETLEKVGDTILDTGEKFYDKTKEVLEGPGKEMAEKAKEISEEMGEKIVKVGKTIAGKTKDAVEKVGDKAESIFDKAQEEAELEKAKPKSEFADTPLDVGESTLKDKDGFFEKASKYADGTYSEKPIISKSDEIEEKEEKITPISGFEDKDNDGDDLIDDAEIIEETKE